MTPNQQAHGDIRKRIQTTDNCRMIPPFQLNNICLGNKSVQASLVWRDFDLTTAGAYLVNELHFLGLFQASNSMADARAGYARTCNQPADCFANAPAKVRGKMQNFHTRVMTGWRSIFQPKHRHRDRCCREDKRQAARMSHRLSCLFAFRVSGPCDAGRAHRPSRFL